MFQNIQKKYIALAVAVVVTVGVCAGMVALGGNHGEVQIQAPKKDELQIISCQDVVQVSVGEVLNLDKLNLVYLCPNEVSYSFTEKVYDATGIYNEELVLTDNATGKTDSTMIRVLVKDAEGNLGTDVGQQPSQELPSQDVSQENPDGTVPEQPSQDGQQEPSNEGQGNTMDAIMYASGSINVRNAPGEAGERIGSLTRGQEVHVIGQDPGTGWFLIEYGEGTAYVSNEYVAENMP